MKALSIRQPWAWAIIRAGKDIENRTWNTTFRGRFKVHTGLNLATNAPDWLMAEYNQALRNGDTCALKGGIIGSVELVNVTTNHQSQWFQGPIGFELRAPVAEEFKKVKGALQFFEVLDMPNN